MKRGKLLICLLVILFGCASEKEENLSSGAESNIQSLEAINEASSPAEAISCSLYGNGIGIECFLGKFYFRLVFYEYHEITHASCFKGFIPHSHIDVKILKQPIKKLNENIDKVLFNIHLGLHKNLEGKWCVLLWITTSGKFTETATGEILCKYHCFKKLKKAKEYAKKKWQEFTKKWGIAGMGGTIGWLLWKGFNCLAIKKCDFAPGWSPSPADEESNNDFDEPDDDSDQPLMDDGPPPLENTDCEYISLEEALYANKNVCFDDTVAGAPLPGNVKPELTVVARRENYVHIFGNNAEIFHRGVFWTDSGANLPAWEINGEWNGFAMVFKLPPCRPWFALSNDAKTAWLAPDGPNTRLENAN